MSGQPTEADITALLADALHREFGAFLAHDPHDADRFWGSTARSVAAALRPLLTDTADARAAGAREALARVEALADEWDARLGREFGLTEPVASKFTDWHSDELRAALAADTATEAGDE